MTSFFVVILTLFLVSFETIHAYTTIPNTGDQLQGFTFAYYTSILQLPILASCPTPLTLTKGNPTNAGGPDPVAPYTMIMLAHEQLLDGAGNSYERTYSKSINVGTLSTLQNIPHPFANNTQFIACIWAANGVSGGCQDLVTVYESPLTDVAYQNASSPCRANVTASWVTPPSQTLDVVMQGGSGILAENGWPAVCSDIMFTPKNGTPPYTLLIAPAFHPPVNISSNSTFAKDYSMNYTVRMTHGQAFMAAVYDFKGNSWAVGPLHAGAATDLDCLQVATGQIYVEPILPGTAGIPAGALAGGVIGAFIVGAIGAGLLVWFLLKRNKRGVGSYILTGTREDLDPYTNPAPDLTRNDSMFLKAPTPYSIDSPEPMSSTDWESSPGIDQTLAYDSHRAYREQMGLADFHPPLTSGSGSNPSHQSGNSATSRAGGGSAGFAGIGAGSPRNNKGQSNSGEGTRSPPAVPQDDNEGEGDGDRPGRSVYVVHSDGGGGNVTIRLPEGVANVVELPPQYRGGVSTPATGDAQNSGGTAAQANTSPTGDLNPISSPLDHALSMPFLAPSPPPRDGNSSSLSGASRGSGVTDEEIRARGEAARGEKSPRFP